MFCVSKAPGSFLSDRQGNIGISSALVLPLVVLSLGLGIDYGYLTLQKREVQSVADLTAIVAASDIAHVQDAARNHFRNNNLNLSIATEGGLFNPEGKLVARDAEALSNGVATITKGRYVPDPAIDVGQRFISGATPADAVQVSIEKPGTLHFASMFSKAPQISAVGTAASTKLAAFSIGSRLASLDEGLLNALLGALLGTKISLKVMDYQALVAADISVQPFIKALATTINLSAATYRDVLLADVTIPQLLASMRTVQGVSTGAMSALKALEIASAKNKKTIKLAQLINLDPKKGLNIDGGSNWDMKISALDVVSAAAAVSNGTNQVAVDIPAGLPGLASVKIKLAIGEPPVETPMARLGAPGSAVRTAQTRLAIQVDIDGLAALAGLRISLPLYVEIAHTEGKLSDIRCYGSTPSNASVSVDTVPGIAEIAIGTVDPSILSNFSEKARVQPATLVDAKIVKIDGIAHVETKNMQAQRLTFSPSDVAAGAVKSVSTKDILTSTTQTLLNNLDVDIQVLFLTLGSPKVIQAALAQTLSAATPQIDNLLYNLLLLAGVRVGEADIRVTGVNCLQPVLVQ